VTITLADGRVLDGPQVRHALGNARRPLGMEDLRRKFLDCFAAGGSRLDAERLFADLQRLETVPSCRGLVRAAPLRVAA